MPRLQAMTMEFTRASVASAKCHAERAQTFYWDTVTPVLGLRVTRAGAKSFVFESKLGGKTIRITIGPATLQIRGVKAPYRFGADLEAARLAGLVAQGIDPRAEKADRVAAQEADRETVRQERAKRDVSGLDAWFVYCEDRRPHWGERHHDDHLLMVQPGGAPRQRAKGKATKPGLLLALLDRPLAQVDARAVDEWVSRETKVRPTRTALGFRMVRAFLNWAGEHPEFGDIAKADAHRPKRTREKLARKAAKSDVLQREMLKGWFAEVGKLSPSMSAVLQFMLLTGCRPGEALDMRWKDVDFVWQSLTLRDKVVGERIVPLTQHVAKLLFELRRVNSIRPNLPRRLDGDAAAQAEHEKWEPSPWVFVSRVRTGERVTVPRNAHGQALTAAGLPHVSLHGLRRSFGTLSEWCETPIGIVAQIQGHAPSAIAERHYRVRPLDLLRQWHQRIEVFILAEAGIEPAAAHEPNRPALALVHKNPEIACFSAQMGGIAAA